MFGRSLLSTDFLIHASDNALHLKEALEVSDLEDADKEQDARLEQ